MLTPADVYPAGGWILVGYILTIVSTGALAHRDLRAALGTSSLAVRVMVAFSAIMALGFVAAWLAFVHAHSVADRFGPTIELVLPAPGPGVHSVINFHTGQLLVPPDVLAEKLAAGSTNFSSEDQDWMRQAGADAFAVPPGNDQLRLFGKAQPVPPLTSGAPFDWAGFSYLDLLYSFGRAGIEGTLPERTFGKANFVIEYLGTTAMDPFVTVVREGTIGMNETISAPGTTRRLAPHHFAPGATDASAAGSPVPQVFVTRDGTMGLLEILGPSQNPSGLSIRYKLVVPAHPTTQPVQLPSASTNH